MQEALGRVRALVFGLGPDGVQEEVDAQVEEAELREDEDRVAHEQHGQQQLAPVVRDGADDVFEVFEVVLGESRLR